jgi:hypothetical protein
MNLTRQPVREVRAPCSGEYAISEPPTRARDRAVYLFFRFRIDTINKPMVSMIINSSYEVISITPFCKTQNREIAARPAAQLGPLCPPTSMIGVGRGLLKFLLDALNYL